MDGQVYETLRYLHIGSSRLSLFLIGLHIAVDWKWVVASSKKNLFSFGFPGAKSTALDLEEAQQKSAS